MCSPLLPVAYLPEVLNCLVVLLFSLSVIYALVFRALRPSDDICSHFSMCYLFLAPFCLHLYSSKALRVTNRAPVTQDRQTKTNKVRSSIYPDFAGVQSF
jgi:hypothetical protein